MHFVPDSAGVPDDLPSAVSDCGVLAAVAVADELLAEEDALSPPSLLHAVSARLRATAVMVSAEILRVRMLVYVLCVGAVAPGERASERGDRSPVWLADFPDGRCGCPSCLLIVFRTRS